FEEGRQRARAQNALALADENLVRLQLKRAEEALGSDRTAEGLAELAEVLREHPTNHVAAERVWSALSQRSLLLPAVPAMTGVTNFTSLQLSPSGAWIFAADEKGAALLWDAHRGERICSIPHRTRVLEAAFGEAAHQLISISADGDVNFWKVPT